MTEIHTEHHPRGTADLVGHAAAEALLLDLWNGGRMPHAVMLCGRPGIGKATLGYRLARFVLAQGAQPAGAGLFDDGPTTLALPPDSPTFRRVASGGHVDLMVLERPWDEKRNRRRGVIPMEMAQKAVQFLRLTSGEGGWRVVLVDAVDDLNASSANALLKVLEEPPPRVLLILIANAVGRVLPTIRSRCRQLALAPLSDEQTRAVVAAHAPDAAADECSLAVRLADGSPGQALALLDEGAAALYVDFIELMGAMPDYDVGRAIAFAEAAGASGDEAPFAAFTGLFAGWIGRLVRGAATGEAAPPLAREGEVNARLAGGSALDPWFEVWDKARAWFAETNALNLDRKQAVLAVIDAAEAAQQVTQGITGRADADRWSTRWPQSRVADT
ncbi:MAG: DNA polymerase III subunit delta' [Alphaproteobacteria bacterium]